MTSNSKGIVSWAPLILAAITLVWLLYEHEFLTCLIANEKIKLSALYSAVFDWSAIQTGFLFGVYGFVASKSDGFIAAIQNTVAKRNFDSYIRRATYMGFSLTFFSIPLVVVDPKPVEMGLPYIAVISWFALFVWAFISFLRVAYSFGIIVKVPDDSSVPAG